MAEPPLASQGLEAISARHNGPASAFAPIKQGAPWPRQSRASLGLRLLLVAIAELALAGLQWSMQGLGRGLPDRSKRVSLLDSDPQGCPWGSPGSAHGLRLLVAPVPLPPDGPPLGLPRWNRPGQCAWFQGETRRPKLWAPMGWEMAQATDRLRWKADSLARKGWGPPLRVCPFGPKARFPRQGLGCWLGAKLGFGCVLPPLPLDSDPPAQPRAGPRAITGLSWQVQAQPSHKKSPAIAGLWI